MNQTDKKRVEDAQKTKKALDLAHEHKAQCHYCGKIGGGADFIILLLRGNPVLAVCPECMIPNDPIMIFRRDFNGQLQIGVKAPQKQAPTRLSLASNIRDVERSLPQGLIQQYSKKVL